MKYELEFALMDVYLERLYEKDIITLSDMEEIRKQMQQLFKNNNTENAA